jgi:hypothetical protein
MVAADILVIPAPHVLRVVTLVGEKQKKKEQRRKRRAQNAVVLSSARGVEREDFSTRTTAGTTRSENESAIRCAERREEDRRRVLLTIEPLLRSGASFVAIILSSPRSHTRWRERGRTESTRNSIRDEEKREDVGRAGGAKE